jgi:hypothetical protein
MHQMRISTNQVSLVMLRSKKLEIQKMWNCDGSSDENQNRVPWDWAKSVEG